MRTSWGGGMVSRVGTWRLGGAHNVLKATQPVSGRGRLDLGKAPGPSLSHHPSVLTTYVLCDRGSAAQPF